LIFKCETQGNLEHTIKETVMNLTSAALRTFVWEGIDRAASQYQHLVTFQLGTARNH